MVSDDVAFLHGSLEQKDLFSFSLWVSSHLFFGISLPVDGQPIRLSRKEILWLVTYVVFRRVVSHYI